MQVLVPEGATGGKTLPRYHKLQRLHLWVKCMGSKCIGVSWQGTQTTCAPLIAKLLNPVHMLVPVRCYGAQTL